VDRLFELHDPARVAAAALKLIVRAQGGERAEQEIPAAAPRLAEGRRAPHGSAQASRLSGPRAAPAGSRQIRRSGERDREAGMVRIYVGAGREAGIRPGDLVGAIANEARINAKAIGAIEIEDRFSIVAVPEAMGRAIIEVLSRARIKGRKVPVRVFHD
jgi:ATP-dependent RNA helicase DeaD